MVLGNARGGDLMWRRKFPVARMATSVLIEEYIIGASNKASTDSSRWPLTRWTVGAMTWNIQKSNLIPGRSKMMLKRCKCLLGRWCQSWQGLGGMEEEARASYDGSLHLCSWRTTSIFLRDFPSIALSTAWFREYSVLREARAATEPSVSLPWNSACLFPLSISRKFQSDPCPPAYWTQRLRTIYCTYIASPRLALASIAKASSRNIRLTLKTAIGISYGTRARSHRRWKGWRDRKTCGRLGGRFLMGHHWFSGYT